MGMVDLSQEFADYLNEMAFNDAREIVDISIHNAEVIMRLDDIKYQSARVKFADENFHKCQVCKEYYSERGDLDSDSICTNCK